VSIALKHETQGKAPADRDAFQTLWQMFQATVRRNGEAVLLHHLGRDWTYGRIAQRAASVAAWLRRHGLEEGQRVGMLLPNSAEYVACYFGILMVGGIVVALDPDTTARELSHTLVDCDPAVVITAKKCERHLASVDDRLGGVHSVIRVEENATPPAGIGGRIVALSEVLKHPPLDAPVAKQDGSALAQIIYTSGTTGHPKGVALSHTNLLANCRSIVQYLRLTPADSVFAVLPFFYSYGNSLLLTHVAVGGRLILAGDFVFWNRALDLMEQQRATGFAGVPSTYAMLLHKSTFKKRAFANLRYITCAGGGLAPAMVREIRPCVEHAEIFLMYGQTEAAARLSTLMPEDLHAKLGSIGKGIPGVELAVLDDRGQPAAVGETGEIVARGDNIMAGYWNDPQGTRAVLRPDGLHTGDMARVDEDGYIYIVGRRSDMIKCGSYRINPKELEELILEMDGVAEVTVAGCPDDILGEVPVAFVIPSPGRNGLCEQDVLERCNRQLPRHKQIRRVEILESIPRTPSGKIKRHELRVT